MKKKPDQPSPATAEQGPNVPFRLSQAMQDAEHRKRLAGSSGPASSVRKINPKDYMPAPSSKPTKSPTRKDKR